MQRPAQLSIDRRGFSQRRIVAISAALMLQAAAIYAVVTGLTISGFRFFPQSLDVQFFERPPPEPRPVVLPRLELVKPPPPTVVQPEIQIQTPPKPHFTVAKMRLRPVMEAPVRLARILPPAAPALVRPGITAPVSIGASHSCERAYPAIALRLDQQGTTVLGFTVNTDGSVSGVQVMKSSGHEMLDDAAIVCATAWRYRPAFENGRPVPARWTTNVQWKLQNGSRAM